MGTGLYIKQKKRTENQSIQNKVKDIKRPQTRKDELRKFTGNCKEYKDNMSGIKIPRRKKHTSGEKPEQVHQISSQKDMTK